LIVVDASAVVELLLRTNTGKRVEDRLFSRGESLHAPHLLDVEVAQALRRFALDKELSPERGAQALEDLIDLPVHRYPHDFLLERIWELRRNLTAYDAAYVALAETLIAPVVTCDGALASAPGHAARIEAY
jgi:predicted nucleic acid-binding protein